jgi:phosphotransferase system enzyme I (PtsP)
MLTTLRRIVSAFNQEPDLEQALVNMTSQVKKVLMTDCCSVHIADYQHQHFLLTASDGLAQDALGNIAIGFSEGLIGLVGQREEPINIANAHQHKHFKYIPEVKEDEYRAFLGTPIIHQRKVLGIISVQQKIARNFTEEEEAFLVTLATQLALAITNAETRTNILKPNTNSHWLKKLKGVSGSPGVALCEILVLQPQVDLASTDLTKVVEAEVDDQIVRLSQAILATKADFKEMSRQLGQIINDESLDIFDVYKQLLDNSSLQQEIINKIQLGWLAESALKLVIERYVAQFDALNDEYIRERATDIRDLGNRILFNLQQIKQETAFPEQFILFAKEVTASMLAQYQHTGLRGIVSLTGSNNSHAAILARAIGLPAIMGVNAVSVGQFDGKFAIIDGYSGELFIDPDESLIREYHHLSIEEEELTKKINKVLLKPSITEDGKSIELLLNAGLINGFEHSEYSGAVGIGLYRTEIPFMERQIFPSEQEQTGWYEKVLKAYPRHSVVMRTLDIGGDKSLPYFPINEDNPFLGWRGIRITLDHPELFLLQIRAMLKANCETNNLEIMLPMVSSIVEVDEALRLINQAYFELNEELNFKVPRPKVGMMIEVPSVIFQLPEFAKRVDFFSVGSNDLTQYLLAVDRNNARVASLYNAFHPAVLRSLNYIAQQSTKLMVPLSLCGELASVPGGAILLLAMGYNKLSMNSHNIARIKWVIRHITMQRAKVILSHVLTLSTTEQIHQYLNDQLEKLNLGGFVRAGM